MRIKIKKLICFTYVALIPQLLVNVSLVIVILFDDNTAFQQWHLLILPD